MNSAKKLSLFSKIEDLGLFNKTDIEKLSQFSENLQNDKQLLFLKNNLFDKVNQEIINYFYSFDNLIDCDVLLKLEKEILLCNFYFLGYDKDYDSLVLINISPSYPNKQVKIGMNIFLYLGLKR